MAEIDHEMLSTDETSTCPESGSFFPCLVPDAFGAVALRLIQSKIKEVYPNSKPAKHLRSALFYCHPRIIRECLRDTDSTNATENNLYSDLRSNFDTISESAKGKELVLPVEGLERFGESEGVVVLTLGRTAVFSAWRENARELLSVTLRNYGILDSNLRAVCTSPQFEWSLGEYTPHVSLMYKVAIGDLPIVELPSRVRFDAISYGDVINKF